MSDMNVVVMSGRLTRDPVRRSTTEGTTVAAFRIVQHPGRQSEHPVYIDAETVGKTAEVVLDYFKKGDPILVRGRLRLDEQDGRHSRHIEIIADQISFYSKARRENLSMGEAEHAEVSP